MNNQDISKKDKYVALTILFIINLLNYMDRYIPSSIKEQFKHDLHLNDFQTSLPLTTFIIVYMISSPIFGYLTDKGISRRLLLSIGILIWAISTCLTYFSINFGIFITCRTIVGIGEAAYSTIAPDLLSDFFPPDQRDKILTIFYLAIPVGGALGFGLGSVVGSFIGWRYTFFFTGIPGLVLAFIIWIIKDPGKTKSNNNINTESNNYDKNFDNHKIGNIEAIKILLKNKNYLCAVIGSVFITFATGGIAGFFLFLS